MTTSRTNIKFKEKNGKILLKSIPEIEQLCRFTWQENINGVPDFSRSSYQNPFQQMSGNSEKLVLTTISDDVGYGIFLDENSAPIEPDQVICMYEGEEIIDCDGAYRLGAINARYHGNIARFVDHLPTRFELLQYEFKSPLTAADVAFANVDIIFLDDSGDFPVLVSNQVIQPGRFVGYSYNYDYWETYKKEPRLFTKTGEPLDPSLYARTGPQKLLYDLTVKTMERALDSGWACADEVENACSHCGTIEEYNRTFFDKVFPLCFKTKNKEGLFWMSVYLEHIINVLDQATLQLANSETTNLLAAKIKPFKSFYRMFDSDDELITRRSVNNIADELQRLVQDESLAVLQPLLADQKANLMRLKDSHLKSGFALKM
jgi:hypothetical protein